MAKRSRQQLGNVPVTMICVNAVTETTISGCFGEGALADSVPLRTASGEFYNGGFAEKLPFTGFYDLVMKLDAVFDYFSFPQRGTQLRTAGKPGPAARFAQMKEDVLPRLTQQWNERVMQNGWGRCATFSVHVYARQNSSWQGRVRWLEGKREENFRSMLELMCFLESVLDIEERSLRIEETGRHGGTKE